MQSNVSPATACLINEPIVPLKRLAGDRALRAHVFNYERFWMQATNAFYDQVFEPVLRDLPNRGFSGEPRKLILNSILVLLGATKTVDRNEMVINPKADDVTVAQFPGLLTQLAFDMSEFARVVSMTSYKTLGDIAREAQFRNIKQAIIDEKEAVFSIRRKKGDDSSVEPIDPSSAFSNSRNQDIYELLTSRLGVRIAATEIEGRAPRVSPDTFNNLADDIISFAGTGVQHRQSLKELDTTLSVLLERLCQLRHQPERMQYNRSIFNVLVAVTYYLDITHPERYDSNFPPIQIGNTDQMRHRAMVNTSYKLASLFGTLAHSASVLDLMMSREVLTSYIRIAEQSFVTDDLLIKDTARRIGQIDTLLERYEFRGVKDFASSFIKSIYHLTGADILLPDQAATYLLKTEFNQVAATVAPTTAETVVNTTDREVLIRIIAPQATHYAMVDGRDRLGLKPFIIALSSAIDAVMIDTEHMYVQLYEVAAREKVAGYQTGFTYVTHQHSRFNHMVSSYLRVSETFDLTVPAYYPFTLESGRVRYETTLLQFLGSHVNVPGVQLQLSKNASVAGSEHRMTFPHLSVPRGLPPATNVSTLVPIEYLAPYFQHYIRPDAQDVFERMNPAQFEGGAWLTPMEAMATRFGMDIAITRLSANNDSYRQQSARQAATALIGTWVMQLRDQEGKWRNVMPYNRYTYGAPTDQFIDRNLRAAGVDTPTENANLIISEGAVRLILCTVFPKIGPTCPVLDALMEDNGGPSAMPKSVLYVQRINATPEQMRADTRWFTSRGYNINLSTLPHVLFRIVEKYIPTPLDLVDVFVAPDRVLAGPRRAYMSVLTCVIEDGSGIEWTDNAKELLPIVDGEIKGVITSPADRDLLEQERQQDRAIQDRVLNEAKKEMVITAGTQNKNLLLEEPNNPRRPADSDADTLRTRADVDRLSPPPEKGGLADEDK